MTEGGLLQHIFERLSLADTGEEIFGADETRQWPAGALASLSKIGMLKPAQPTQVIECDGCERNCFMPVHVRAAESTRPALAFISCDKPEDMGRIAVNFSRLERWQMTNESLAGAVARLLDFAKPAQADGTSKRWTLGLLAGNEGMGTITLSVENGVTLMLAGKGVPLPYVLTLGTDGLTADRDALLRIVEGDAREPAAGIGSPTWRKRQAQAAARARHNKPGGSNDKHRQMREAWASGKYTSRDRCAEEECAALGMSFSAARKALRNAPEPKRLA